MRRALRFGEHPKLSLHCGSALRLVIVIRESAKFGVRLQSEAATSLRARLRRGRRCFRRGRRLKGSGLPMRVVDDFEAWNAP